MTPEQELEARKQDSVYNGADESELPPDEEEEPWPGFTEEEWLAYLKEIEWGGIARRAREGYEP